MNEYRERHGEEKLSKKDEIIGKLYDWVMSEYDNGRITVISEGEMATHYEELMKKRR